jgi:putative ABC transport system substrate-binding protein
MRRRDFITLLGGAAAAWPLVAPRAQQAERRRRVGVLMSSSADDLAVQSLFAAFQEELQKLGWAPGRNILIDVRFVAGDAARVHATVAELMALTPDLLVAHSNAVAEIVQSEVRTIPVIFVGISDPVGSGFVSNEAHPTGNLTGFANFEPSVGGKWLELLKEFIPSIERVGFMLHPGTPANIGFLKSAEAAAARLSVRVIALGVHDAGEVERAMKTFASADNSGFVIAPHAITTVNRDLIVASAANLRQPAIYPWDYDTKAGGLISYGFDKKRQFQQAAGYVDRILRGAKPADLPVQYPTKFQLIVNLKSAKAIGLAIPESLLARADEVIE